MSRFFVLHECYSPNSASTVRLMGLLKELSARRIETHVVFFISDTKRSEAPSLPGINYEYYWKHGRVRNQKLQILNYLCRYSRKFCSEARPGDKIYLYRCDKMVNRLVKLPGVQVFQERTEHPDVSHFMFMNIGRYLSSCRRLSGIFVISSALKHYYVDHGIDAGRIHIINMTVDSSRFSGLEKSMDKGQYIAYCGSSMIAKDGVDQLLKSFSMVAKQYPFLQLYIIGNSSSGKSGNIITRLIELLGITDRVVMTGIVPFAQLPQLLKDAAILALERPDNKQARYGFPTKLGEYLLTGNPVIVSSVGDIPLFLKDEESAYLVEPDNPEKFAEKIVYALEHPQLSESVGLAGREVALKSFDSRQEAGKIVDIIFGSCR